MPRNRKTKILIFCLQKYFDKVKTIVVLWLVKVTQTRRKKKQLVLSSIIKV